jgi:predicted esterase
MRHTQLLLLLLSLSSILLDAQSVDGSFDFQTESNKKYSLYIPSGYDADIPQDMMLGLHPLNVNRWDGAAWRDTLIEFAENNNLLLVCPDGGSDGRIDDPIDTAFTTALIDSVETWYNINPEQKYIMGFSWGGKTTYTYGLRRTDEFSGYLVIGAAVNQFEVEQNISAAEDENFYLVHGTNDTPATRYTPLLNALEDNGACVGTNLLQGVGHTIDFPNRNTILSEGYEFLKSNDCSDISNTEDIKRNIHLNPNPFVEKLQLVASGITNPHIQILDINGRSIPFTYDDSEIHIHNEVKGLLIVIIESEGIQYVKRIYKQ